MKLPLSTLEPPHAMPHHALPCSGMPCRTMPCLLVCTMPSRAVQCSRAKCVQHFSHDVLSVCCRSAVDLRCACAWRSSAATV